MSHKKAIKKTLNFQLRKRLSKLITKNWVYKLSIRDCEMFFELGELSPFGLFFKKLKSGQFVKQYNELFNGKESHSKLLKDAYRFKLQLRIQELRAIYIVLSSGSDAENSRQRYKDIFGKEWDKDFDIINKKVKFYIDKIEQLPNDTQEGILFSELVALVEGSRGVYIDRSLKLFEFHRIYLSELKKWQNSRT